MRLAHLWSACVVLTLVSAGCTRENPDFTGNPRPPDGGGGGGDLSGTKELGLVADLARREQGPTPSKPEGVDVLIVVDNSGGMETPQTWLATTIDTLIGGLKALPGVNFRVGVTTTDMGVGPYQNAGCTDTGHQGSLLIPPECPRPKGGVRFVEQVGSVVNVSGSAEAAVSCYVQQGSGGCGFEQPLKAMKAALTQANKGFLRPGAALAVVVLTNEDDCSAAKDSLFDPYDSGLGPYSSYRCFQYGVLCSGQQPPLEATVLGGCQPGQQWLHDVKTEYADPILGLRPPGWTSILVIAAPPRKTITVEQVGYNPPQFQVKESCNAGGMYGMPAPRLEQFVALTGGELASVCGGNYRPALSSLSSRIQAAF
jgi:hypothetical protein